MRLRNIKGASETIKESKYLVIDPSSYQNKYKELFNNDNPIYLEIGMGKGNFIVENAKKYPNINFIGIEKYDSVLLRAIEKLEDIDLPNLKLIRFDAENIEEIFSKEIDLIYLNFSDPWPKDRHAKRRLSSPNYLKKYENIFKNDYHIIMKTDNRKLFEYSIKSYVECGYQIEDISLNLYDDDYKENIPTEYEIKFSSKGFPIYMVNVIKTRH